MHTLAGRFVRARDVEGATKISNKTVMDELVSQMATYELGMLNDKWTKTRRPNPNRNILTIETVLVPVNIINRIVSIIYSRTIAECVYIER
jgi:hypothetical protein